MCARYAATLFAHKCTEQLYTCACTVHTYVHTCIAYAPSFLISKHFACNADLEKTNHNQTCTEHHSTSPCCIQSLTTSAVTSMPTHQHTVPKGGPHSTLDLLGDQLGHCKSVVLSDVVQQTQSMVLNRRAERRDTQCT